MRKNFFFMLALPFLLTACNKSAPAEKCGYATTTAVAPAAEIADLKAYLDAHSLAYTQHPSGIFYQVTTQGSGAAPVVCSDVTVKYEGHLTNGNSFDNSNASYPNGIAFTLGQLIPGWQIGIPLIRKAGSITLYIPPSLGYGQKDIRDKNGLIAIPANSNLIFNIELVNVQ